MASSQYSGQSNSSCAANSVGYSPWGPPGPSQHQFVENFYNNPVQYPANGTSNSAGGYRYPMIPTNQPPLPANNVACYAQQPQQNSKTCHSSHYPADYQSFHQNGRKCSNPR